MTIMPQWLACSQRGTLLHRVRMDRSELEDVKSRRGACNGCCRGYTVLLSELKDAKNKIAMQEDTISNLQTEREARKI